MAIVVIVAVAAAAPIVAGVAAILLTDQKPLKPERLEDEVDSQKIGPFTSTFRLLSGQLLQGNFRGLPGAAAARTRVAEALGWPRECVQMVSTNAGTVIVDTDPLPEEGAGEVVVVLNHEALRRALALCDAQLPSLDPPPPIVQAVLNGSVDAVRLYLLSGADPNEVDTAHRGRTALHVAASKRSDVMVRLLLSAKADVRAVDDGGFSPLHRAAKSQCADTTRSLLNAGADRNLVAVSRLDGSKRGMTPTELAVKTNNLDLIEVFAEHVQQHQAASIILPTKVGV